MRQTHLVLMGLVVITLGACTSAPPLLPEGRLAKERSAALAARLTRSFDRTYWEMMRNARMRVIVAGRLANIESPEVLKAADREFESYIEQNAELARKEAAKLREEYEQLEEEISRQGREVLRQRAMEKAKAGDAPLPDTNVGDPPKTGL